MSISGGQDIVDANQNAGQQPPDFGDFDLISKYPNFCSNVLGSVCIHPTL
jgi:hypothetical protein